MLSQSHKKSTWPRLLVKSLSVILFEDILARDVKNEHNDAIPFSFFLLIISPVWPLALFLKKSTILTKTTIWRKLVVLITKQRFVFALEI